jgi:glyoxylase-like metal-dependent hydrolase (beta-lactamase superfamily II)
MARRLDTADFSAPREIAPGVHYLEVGTGLLRSNVYFVRSGTSWTLIDAASADCGRSIQRAAESLFGGDSPPAAILLTHDHPDHAGSARELARLWDRPVWVHSDEMPLVLGGVPVFHTYANPLDRWMILPWLRLLGPRRTESMLARQSLKEVVGALDPCAPLPGLPDWEMVPTPGHTPGHVAFFRPRDRVLVTGDALLTVDLNSWRGLVLRRQEVAGPPWYVTWSRRWAKRSASVLAGLEPLVVASGHGVPMTGPETPARVRALSARL